MRRIITVNDVRPMCLDNQQASAIQPVEQKNLPIPTSNSPLIEARKAFAKEIFPVAGSYSASKFVELIKTSGKVLDPFTQKLRPASSAETILNEKMAIAGYVGYSKSDNHASQIFNAKEKARLELKRLQGILSNEGGRSRSRNMELSYYTPGVPDMQIRRDRDYHARISFGFDKE